MPENVWPRIHLVIAGGYDSRLAENVDHFAELTRLADFLDLTNQITFLRSLSEPAKRALLVRCLALLYTPSNEHFGIVPVEAMYCGKPVIAVNSGGPLETVENKRTGFLLEATAEKFAEAMALLVENPQMAREFGQSGRKVVQQKFSFESFADSLNAICSQLLL